MDKPGKSSIIVSTNVLCLPIRMSALRRAKVLANQMLKALNIWCQLCLSMQKIIHGLRIMYLYPSRPRASYRECVVHSQVGTKCPPNGGTVQFHENLHHQSSAHQDAIFVVKSITIFKDVRHPDPRYVKQEITTSVDFLPMVFGSSALILLDPPDELLLDLSHISRTPWRKNHQLRVAGLFCRILVTIACDCDS